MEAAVVVPVILQYFYGLSWSLTMDCDGQTPKIREAELNKLNDTFQKLSLGSA